MKSKILAVWFSNYYSGCGEQFFRRAMEGIGFDVKTIHLEEPNVDRSIIYQVEKFKPEILFHVPYPNSVRQEVIRYVTKNTKTCTLGWMGDDEWLWRASDPHSPKFIAHDYDYCVTTSRGALSRYSEIGYENAILGQWGYSKSDWMRKETKKEIDVYFCGAENPMRTMYLEALMREKINLVFDGPGYGVSSYEKFRNKNTGGVSGKIDLTTMVNRYRKAKIAVNFNFGSKDNIFYEQIKARTFEIPAVGTFQLSYNAFELGYYFNVGKEVAVFSSPETMVEKVRYYLKNERLREEIAENGHRRNKNYSYEKVLKNIFLKLRK